METAFLAFFQDLQQQSPVSGHPASQITSSLYRISLYLEPEAAIFWGLLTALASPGIRQCGPRGRGARGHTESRLGVWGRQAGGGAECELLDILRAYGGRPNHHRTSGTLFYEIPKPR